MDDDPDGVHKVVQAAARHGLDGDWARQAAQLDGPEQAPFWEQVAAELDAITVAAEARSRFRAVLSQISARSHPSREGHSRRTAARVPQVMPRYAR